MKKLIKGIEYNTDTAREIGCYRYSSCGREYLYQTQDARFFLFDEGGPRSEHCPIVPLTTDMASAWVTYHLGMSESEYEAIFG